MLRSLLPTVAVGAVLLAVLVAVPAADVPVDKIQMLVKQLGSDNFDEREKAGLTLLEIGDPAVEELKKAARGDDPEISQRATKLLAAIAKQPKKPAPPKGPPAKVPDSIRKLIDQLGDDKFEVREAATKELVKLGPEAVPGLRLALEHVDAEVRLRARRVLDTIQTSLTYLKSAFKDPDPAVRKEAAEVLERMGDKAKDAVPTLVEAIKDKDEDVREAVIMALLAIDPENKALADTSPLKASVNGKYTKLLRRIHVPQDKANYTEFSDFGMYSGTSYAGFNDLPAGYWVYVYPHWYIWGEQKK